MAKTKSITRSRKEFNRNFLWLLCISSVVLIASVVLETIYRPTNSALINEAIDSIVFTVLQVGSSTIAGASLVALIIDNYQAAVRADTSSMTDVIESEGIVEIYRNANDPKLASRLEELIGTAQTEIIAFGLGLGILNNNRSLLIAIAQRINSTPNLKTTILLGSEQNIGVMNRLEEEYAWHQNRAVNYDKDWVTKYPAEISSIIMSYTDEKNAPRVSVEQIDTCFMYGSIVIDGHAFFHLYGSPDIRGSESPWYEFIYSIHDEGHIPKFIRRSINYYAELSASAK